MSDATHAQPAAVPSSGRGRGLTGAEIARGTFWTLAFLAALFVTGAVFAAVVALCQKLLGPVWGHAVGTILTVVLLFVMVLGSLLTMADRKWGSLVQDRLGPNRARLPIPGLRNNSLGGIPHLVADVFKMLTKEETIPAEGARFIFNLAPALAFGPVIVLFGVVPMSPDFPLLGQVVRMQVAVVDQGLLVVFGAASIAVLGTALAGWASNSKFALLGGMRASAQMISYEVTLGLTLVGLMIVFGTLRLDTMTVEQGGRLWGFLPQWGVFFQPLAIIAYFAAASAELKRAPFDLPEGESEIVGYFIEYSGLKFGMFMISEYIEVVIFAGLFTSLFFGGYHLPWGEARLAALIGPSLMGLVYLWVFMAKTIFFCWLSLVVRWTFPRFRYDQVMDLGWKMLLPLSLLNVVVTGVAMLLGGREAAAVVGLLELAGLLLWVIGAPALDRQGGETALAEETHAPVAHAHADPHAAH
jgi:NADH-quinone oxidoreductase subunit H